MNLFESAGRERLSNTAPLAERLRPRTLDDILGQDDLVGPGRPLRAMVNSGRLRSFILWGPPGTGKTTIARVVAEECDAEVEHLSAVSASVADIRAAANAATMRLGERSRRSVLFLDEIHRFTRSQQDALLPHVESGLLTLIGATTESPWATLNRPLLSRLTVLKVAPLADAAQRTLVERAVSESGVQIEPDALDRLITAAQGDGRRLLTVFEAASAGARSTSEGAVIDRDALDDAIGAGLGHYTVGDHYDAASALIKHLRASHAEQAMAWLVHMLDGGEDPRFIARRLLIFASEDIGIADRSALLIAEAASRAVEFVGMPEARYSLGHAVLVLARAPKSREVGAALEAAVGARLEPPPGK